MVNDIEYLKTIRVLAPDGSIEEYDLFTVSNYLVKMQDFAKHKAEYLSAVKPIVPSLETTDTYTTAANKVEAEAEAKDVFIKAVNDIIAPVEPTDTLSDIAKKIASKKFDYALFDGCTFYLNKDITEIPDVDYSQLTTMSECFFNTSLSGEVSFSLPNVVNMDSCFSGTYITKVALTNTSKLENAQYMFYACRSLAEVFISDMSNVTDVVGMFQACRALSTAPITDLPKATTAAVMYNSTGITEVPYFNAPNVTSIQEIFAYCASLISVGKMTIPNVENISYAFSYCSALTIAPSLDTPKATKIDAVFYGCTSLTSVPLLNVSSVTSIAAFTFYNCKKLTYMFVQNIGLATEASSFDFSRATVWGTGDEASRQSLIDSMITYSYDRVTAELSVATIVLSANTYAVLTEEEIASITAKGYTLTSA